MGGTRTLNQRLKRATVYRVKLTLLPIRAMQTKRKGEKWPFIRWVEKERAWKVDARTKDGGQRRFFDNEDEATGWAEKQRIRRQNEGDRSFDDSELAQFGLTVADAIKFTLDHYRRQAASVPLESAMNELIAAKKGTGRRQRYCNDLRLRLGRLCAVFENMTVAQISTADLENFLAGLNVAPETRNTFRRDCGARPSRSLKSRRWQARPSSSITSMERCQAIDLRGVQLSQVEQPPLHHPISANPRGLSQTIIDMFLAIFALYFPLQEHAAIFASPRLSRL